MNINQLANELSWLKETSAPTLLVEANMLQRKALKIIRKYDFQVVGKPTAQATMFEVGADATRGMFQQFIREIARATEGTTLRQGYSYRIEYTHIQLAMLFFKLEAKVTEGIWTLKVIKK